MKILVIDGQGGGIGRQVVQAVKAAFPEADVTPGGENSPAAAGVVQGGAGPRAAGGEPRPRRRRGDHHDHH